MAGFAQQQATGPTKGGPIARVGNPFTAQNLPAPGAAQQMPNGGIAAPFGGGAAVSGRMKATGSKGSIAKPGKFGKGGNLNRLATVLAGQNQRGPANLPTPNGAGAGNPGGRRGNGNGGNGNYGRGGVGTRPPVIPIKGRFVA